LTADITTGWAVRLSEEEFASKGTSREGKSRLLETGVVERF
jgi:hypothetical protein